MAVDQPVQAASESQVIDKLHAFFVALEYLNICEFTTGAGPLRYLAELEEWRHENRGLALLLTVDTLIRRKTHRLNHDQRKSFPTFSSALLEVLTNHKQLWNDARSSAELDKFKQAGQQHPETPVRAPKRQLSDDDSPIVKTVFESQEEQGQERAAQGAARQSQGQPRQTMDPSRQERKLTKMLVFRQQNGTRSHRSSIMGSVAAHFTIVQWVAGLETRADMLMRVLSVARDHPSHGNH